MAIHWEKCFLCDGYGRIEISSQFHNLRKPKNIQCPLCRGRGNQAIKSGEPWNKSRRDQL